METIAIEKTTNLREIEKSLKRELAQIKKRINLTPEMIAEMKQVSDTWLKRLKSRKKLTPLEQLQFDYYHKKRSLLGFKIEGMIFRCKPGPWDQALWELCDNYGLNVHYLLVQIKRNDEFMGLLSAELKGLDKSTQALVESFSST